MSAGIQLVTVMRDEWQALARRFRDHNDRQVWDFGVACAERLGARSQHIAVRNGGRVLALADVRVKRLPLTGAGIAYINGGPLVRREDGADATRALAPTLDALATEFTHRRGLVLRITPALGPADWLESQSETFVEAGFSAASNRKPCRTMVVDIRPPEKDIRRALQQKWRNCLNRAERNGLTVRRGTGPDLFTEFSRLYAQMQARKPFTVELNPSFYARVQQTLPSADAFEISIAEFDGRPCAGYVGSFLGDTAVYLLGTTNELGMQQKAAYLLQWESLLAARKRGCHWYDLGGIDPEGNPGVYHFKKGLAGVDVTVPGPFELEPSQLTGKIVRIGEQIFRRVRALRTAVRSRRTVAIAELKSNRLLGTK